MKKTITTLIICSCIFVLNAQQIVLPSGNSIANANGSVSYSIGQICFTNITDINGELNLGIQNPFDMYRLQGRFISIQYKPVNNVSVNVVGSNTQASKSNALGNYISNLSSGNFTIKPTKNNDIIKANGVSSADVILVQRHILNLTKLNSAYKLIAADVTNDKNINSTDVIRMKRLILGLDTTFIGNRLWAFVDSAYQFPDTTNPFPYKDSISFTNLTSNKTNQTFIGIKLGDVNYDWNASVAKGVANNNLQLVANSATSNDNHQQVIFTSSNFTNMVAMQTTLHFDNTKYEFVAIKNNKLEIEYNASKANTTGNIGLLWADKNTEAKTFAKDETLFTLILKPKDVRFTKYDETLSLNNDITQTEALENKATSVKGIVLTKQTTQDVSNNKQGFTVAPNPTTGLIMVNIVSNANKFVQFELSNIYGKTILQQNLEVVKGNNTCNINLNRNGKLAAGIYFLKSVGLEDENVKKIIVE